MSKITVCLTHFSPGCSDRPVQAVGLEDLQPLAGVVKLPADKYKGSAQRTGRGVFGQR